MACQMSAPDCDGAEAEAADQLMVGWLSCKTLKWSAAAAGSLITDKSREPRPPSVDTKIRAHKAARDRDPDRG